MGLFGPPTVELGTSFGVVTVCLPSPSPVPRVPRRLEVLGGAAGHAHDDVSGGPVLA